ncbi:MAG: hypothetical protein IPI46_13890 [Bacteroidetes bacterium]|nr:hypothetical protein [Bacteroidota bacterium]
MKQKDSVLYSRLKQDGGFEELKANSKEASLKKAKSSLTSTIDSLKKIENYATSKLNTAKSVFDKIGFETSKLEELNSLQEKLDYNQALNNQIQSITSQYKGFGNIKGIEKQTYYYQQQLKAFKNIANDPSILEEKALNYLRGMKGFEEHLSNSHYSLAGKQNSNGSIQNNLSAGDLEKMGYQTKRQVNKQLSTQIGNSSEKLQELNTQVKKQVEDIKKVKQDITKAKDALHKIKKPSFKVNSMRELPLRLRLEKSYNWQVLKSNNDLPAILEMNAQLGFKHTPRLTYSFVAGGSLGMGTNWQNIKLSFEGLRIGVNANVKWIFGISGQVGYERVYKNYQDTKLIPATDGIPQQLITTTKYYRDIAYCGIQKTYKINSKYSGTMLLAYDFLWKSGNASTPVIWRFGWKKN